LVVAEHSLHQRRICMTCSQQHKDWCLHMGTEDTALEVEPC
jgi:hypothetical protein